MLLLMLYPDPTVKFQPHPQPQSSPSTLISLPLVLFFMPFLPFSPPALLFSPCSPAQLSPLSLFLSSDPLSSVMCPPAPPDPLFPRFSARSCSFLFTGSLTLEYVPHGGFCPPDLCCPGLPRTLASEGGRFILCQQSKVQTHVPSPVPGRRFSHHLDLVGPLPSSQGFCYILTIIDRTSRWPEAVPLLSITAESCARAFISTWILRIEVPALLTSDRGAQFTSSVWSEVCSVLGNSHIQTTNNHPQSNGMIERFHRSSKSDLRARLAGSDWIHHLH